MFYVRPSDFFSVSLKVRHVMGGIIMTSIEYTEKSLTLTGFEPGPSRTGVGYSNHATKAFTICFCWILQKNVEQMDIFFALRYLMGPFHNSFCVCKLHKLRPKSANCQIVAMQADVYWAPNHVAKERFSMIQCN